MSKTRQWAMLTAVVCLAVLAAGWLLVIKPQRASAAKFRTQTQGVEATNSDLRSQISMLRQQQKGLPQQQKQIADIARKVPDNPALPTLIRQLSSAADGAGVTLVTLAPGQPTVSQVPVSGATSSATTGATSSATTGATSAAAPAAAAPLDVIPVTIQVQGAYFNVEQFFGAVESLSRAMLVSGFTISPVAGSGGGSAQSGASGSGQPGAETLPPGTLTAQITASVFVSPSTATTGH